ncbi:P-loop containing nucleoside triphosphate hydrolase protein [Xylariomycetidae sp. FL2044]|nr:P-loop containing nucleoside triphosphate hydrolase protein [Xylariomycetidae sp. FL2044]
MEEDRKAVIVGISGASSSGKTTLARLLRDIFPHTFILHEDDFYKPESELPMRDGLLDWDCAEAISVPDMKKALEWIRKEGSFPPFVDSKEDQNSVGACPVSDAKIAAMRSRVQSWLEPGQPGHAIFFAPSSSSPSSQTQTQPLRICLLDGFLLYSPTDLAPILPLLDVRLFLLVSRAKATRRREARDGYVTLEGFWKDPPGYVDRVVWPNYVEAHRWLFEGGDVERGVLDGEVLRENGILAQGGLKRGAGPSGEGGGGMDVDVDMETSLEWAVETLMRELEVKVGGVGAGAGR